MEILIEFFTQHKKIIISSASHATTDGMISGMISEGICIISSTEQNTETQC